MKQKQNLLQRLFSPKRDEKRAFIPNGTFTPMSAVFGTMNDNVVHANALKLSAVYACVSKIADTIASMDVNVEKKEKDGSTEPLFQHPVTRLLAVEPNDMMGAYEFWQMIVSDALLYGVGYALITPDSQEMYWLPSNDVSFKVNAQTGEKWYTYPGSPSPVPQERILEIKAFRGLAPTKVHEQTLFTGKAIQDFGSTFFQNGGMLGGILTTKEYMDPEQMVEASNMWRREYMGSKNAHKVAILGGGFTYQPLSVPLDQLQWLESKKYSAEEIARFYQVPPPMIGLDSNTTYSNYEQQVLQFNQGTIIPWLRRIELEVERKLLRSSDSLSCRFNVEGLLRGDLATRASYYHSLLTDGVLTINEVRAKEGMGAIEGGDANLVSLNQIPLDMVDRYADNIVSPSTPNVQGGRNGGEDNEEEPQQDNQTK